MRDEKFVNRNIQNIWGKVHLKKADRDTKVDCNKKKMNNN